MDDLLNCQDNFSSPFTKRGIQIERIHKCSAQNVNSRPAPGLREKEEEDENKSGRVNGNERRIAARF